MTVSNERSPGQKASLSVKERPRKLRKDNIILCTLLAYPITCRRVKVVDAASDEEELSDEVCEIALANFKP